MNVVPIVRWFLPWAVVLVVSTAIAHAAGAALERNLGEQPEPVALVTQPPCQRACPHWADITSVDTEGRDIHVRCLVVDDRFAADALQVHYADLNAVVGDLCAELWR